jgi:hypothetical protein
MRLRRDILSMQQGAGTTDLDKAMRGIVVKLKPAA